MKPMKKYAVIKVVNGRESFEVIKYISLSMALELAENLSIIDVQMELDADTIFKVIDLFGDKVIRTFKN